MPLSLDEKQITKSQTEIEKLVYMLGNGISRIRGNKTGGVQQLNTWNTIVIATGEETISKTNSTTGIQTRCLEIEGSPFNNDEERASEMYGIIEEQYGTAGPVFIQKIVDEYSKNDYQDLKNKYHELEEKIKNMNINDIHSYVTSVSLVTLADILISDWLFDEKDETDSMNMATDILKNLANSKDIDITDKCYQYIVSWIVGNHKSFDTYKTTQTNYEKNYATLNPADDLVETNRTQKSFGIYDKGVYYVLRHILEDKLESKGYSYRKIVSEFGKRGYIKPTKDRNGQISTNTVQRKYRGINARFFAFPIDNINKFWSDEIKEQKQKDFAAQFCGFKDDEDRENALEKLLESQPLTGEDIEELMKIKKELEEKNKTIS